MEKYNAKIKDNPQVEFIHISEDHEKEAAEAWAAEAGLSWLTVMVEDAENNGLFDYKSVAETPCYTLLSPDGKEVVNGSDEVFAKIAELKDS